MSGQDHRAPEAPAEHPPRGFNGLPEVEDLGLTTPAEIAFTGPATDLPKVGGQALATWVALAAIIVPAVIVYTQLSRRRRPSPAGRVVNLAARHRHDGIDVAPPHGDKLLFRP
jgi:hypothetical protein